MSPVIVACTMIRLRAVVSLTVQTGDTLYVSLNIIVKGSSTTRIGWTRDSPPKLSAAAWKRKPPMSAPIPPSQAGLRIR